MSRIVDFPDLTTTTDADEANHQNYLAWKAQHAQRRRQSITLFNLYQCHNIQRMCSQAQYKDEALRESETLKDEIERRISNACDCPTCESNAASLRDEGKSRRSSDFSIASRDSASSSNTSLSKMASAPGPTKAMPSGKNSLIASPPPRSRHHRRRAKSLSS